MRLTLFFLLLILLPFSGVQAALPDLYSGEAVVETKDESERRRALPLALENVLQKLSGIRSFEDYPEVRPALRAAPSMMLSFHYRNAEYMLPDGTDIEELRLVVRFSGQRVDELARNLKLPIWQPERSPTEIWVVVDDGLDRKILPVEYAYAWQAMADAAGWRGLPIVIPEPDEDGQFVVDAQLLWGGYSEDLAPGPESGALIAAARREGALWSVRSNLTYRGQTWTWRQQDLNLQTALAESVQQAADMIASANSIAHSDRGAWVQELLVTGLGQQEDYSRCLAYLQGLSVVTDVGVVSAEPGTVKFRLELNALPQYLEDALLDGRVLEFDEKEQSYLLLP